MQPISRIRNESVLQSKKSNWDCIGTALAFDLFISDRKSIGSKLVLAFALAIDWFIKDLANRSHALYKACDRLGGSEMKLYYRDRVP